MLQAHSGTIQKRSNSRRKDCMQKMMKTKQRAMAGSRKLVAALMVTAVPAGLIVLCGASASKAPVANEEHFAAAQAGDPSEFNVKVQPIFEAHCDSCHSAARHRGGLDLTTKAGMMKGGHDGPVIVAGDPASSLLVKLIRHEGPAGGPPPMPMNGDKLSDADIATVSQWIKDGASMPDDPPAPPAAN
jgi:cytochrome c